MTICSTCASTARVLSLLAISGFLTAASAQNFGSTVAVSGAEVFVGDGANPAFPGKVYVYAESEGVWNERPRLKASNAQTPKPNVGGEAIPVDRFGSSIAASDDLVVVGAPGVRSVYLFERQTGGVWTEIALVASDKEGFGSAVATDGDHVLIASRGNDESEAIVLVYDRNSDWQDPTILSVGNLMPGDGFGSALAIKNGVALVGAPGTAENAGAVYSFVQTAANMWSSGGALASRLTGSGNRFGETVTFVDATGTQAAVGMPGFADRTGMVLVFERDSTTWSVSERLSPFSSVRSEGFGSSIAVAGDHMWVGAPGYGGRFGTGAVYTFQLTNNLPGDVATAIAGHLGRGGTDEQTIGLGRTTASSVLSVRNLQMRSQFGSTIAANDQIAIVGAPGFDNRAGAGIGFVQTGQGSVDDAWAQGTPLINEIETYASMTGDMIECDQDLAGDFPCDGVDMSAFLSLKDLGADRGIRLNDLWGWEDETTGREYAIVGLSNQASFVDVTDPFEPVYLGKLPMPESANMSVWRDMKVYKDHAYIVSDGAGDHGMQVFDLRQLRGVTTPRLFEPTAHYRGIHSAHNIVINEDTGFAYSVGSSSGGETCGGGLHMIDIREPANPVFAGCFSDGTTGRRGTGYSHDAQCVVYAGPDSDYSGREICIGSNETALSIADVTEKDNPKSVSIATYPHVQYTHQGWLTDDHRYFYLNDELDENAGLVEGTRTMIFDLADLDDPLLVGEHIARTTEVDHNLYVKGDLMYQSNTGAGLRILDISDPENPFETAYFDTSPVGGRGGTWSNYPYFKSGKIVVTGGHYGLFVLRKTPVEF